MTAVEWIFEELENKENGFPYLTLEQIYNKAKEMEKEQQGYSEEDTQEYAKFCIECDRLGLPCIIAKDWYENYKK